MALRAAAALALVASVFVSGAYAQGTGLESSLQGFIRVSGLNFVDDNCNDFFFSGYNTWEAIEAAGEACCGGRVGLNEQLQLAVANNLTVVRMFAFAVVNGVNLQEAPGVYNETLFQAFDYVMDRASTLGLKLIPVLSNNWEYNSNMTDTKCWYTNNTETAEGCDDFWTNPEAIQLYKDSVKAILTRVNSINGKVYGQDPTVFAWNLINEGRCDTVNCTAADIQYWITTVAPYVKSLTGSLVTVGQEGFYGAGNCHADNVNPVPNSDGWVLETGEDFLPNHIVPGIDYTSIHMWSDNWGRTDVPFANGWLYAHMEDSKTIGRPLVLEEFGKADAPFTTNGQIYGQGQTEQNQADYYKLVYSITETSIIANEALKGIAFWRWDAVSSGTILSPLDEALTLNSSSSAFTEVVVPFSQRVKEKSLAHTPLPGCQAVAAPAAVAPAVATQSITNGGRRLAQLQATTPVAAPAILTPENVNAAVTNCTAYFGYSVAGSQ